MWLYLSTLHSNTNNSSCSRIFGSLIISFEKNILQVKCIHFNNFPNKSFHLVQLWHCLMWDKLINKHHLKGNKIKFKLLFNYFFSDLYMMKRNSWRKKKKHLQTSLKWVVFYVVSFISKNRFLLFICLKLSLLFSFRLNIWFVKIKSSIVLVIFLF